MRTTSGLSQFRQPLSGERRHFARWQCRSRFENGYGAILDVIDAEMALEKTRIEKATALYDFNRAYMDLCTASGEPERAVSLYSSTRENP